MNTCRLYSDFNCPFCYAMHERLHTLGVMDRISWQGVQHAPHLPSPMVSWAGRMGAELKQEVEMVRRLAPDVPITVPQGKPNTRRAIVASIRAHHIDPLRARDFVSSLYRLFWVEGQDLSDEALLQREAGCHGFLPEQVSEANTMAVDPVLRAWEGQWVETEQQGVPLLQRSDGTVLVGLLPLDVIQRFLAGG
ncbi:MAG: DsbA family protein [Nitrospira sp.]|nr:DsbA family protein [Nitrospira sp.]